MKSNRSPSKTPASSHETVDQSRFQEAQQAYEAGEFRVAAKGFLASATRGPDGNGAAYHMAGNALMRLRRYQDAVTVYGHALRDSIYDRRGAVWANLGAAYVEIGDYTEAAKAYEEAIEEPDYATPYKAYQGMAGALLERGRVEEAAVSYRKAALDPGNPDPGKALVNLGLCFMALGRAEDAIEAYQAALGFDQYEGRGKALANLGQAHVALGQYAEAVRAFEKSTQMHGHKLSPAASAAYATALQQLHPEGTQTAEQSTRPVIADDATIAQFFGEEPAQTASIPQIGADAEPAEAAVAVATAAPPDVAAVVSEAVSHAPAEVTATSGLEASADVAAPLSEVATRPPETTIPASAPAPAAPEMIPGQTVRPLAPFDHGIAESDLGIGDEKAVADFFSVSEEELKARGREASRAERHAKGPHAIWRTVAVVAVAAVLVLAGLIGAYEMGYGWPTQNQSVAGMMNAYQAGTPTDSYWVAAPTKDIKKEMAKIPPVKSFTIGTVVQHATASKVPITVTPQTGAALHYTITLSREGVGWKVSAVDNDWSTTGG
jgi:tetratricopeptide (TPR) repeat protein